MKNLKDRRAVSEMHIGGREFTPREPKPPALVEYWYSRDTRSWAVRLMDEDGNQVGNTEYSYTRREAVKQGEDWRKEHNITAPLKKA